MARKRKATNGDNGDKPPDPLQDPDAAIEHLRAALASGGGDEFINALRRVNRANRHRFGLVSDRAAAQSAKAEGMARVEANADPYWRAMADQAVFETACEFREFLIDEVRDKFNEIAPEIAETGTHDLRALGPVMTAAAKAGWIEKAGVEESKKPQLHGDKRTLWRSLQF